MYRLKLPILLLLIFWSLLIKAQNDFVFIPNAGQWDNKAILKADVKGGAVFLEKNCLTFAFYSEKSFLHAHDEKPDSTIKLHAFKIEFLNSNTNVELLLQKKGTTLYNYFLGSNAKNWGTALQGGGEVIYSNLYPNINLKIYSQNGSLKYDFIVLPGGDPSNIQLKIDGASDLALIRGDLQITTTVNQLLDKAPFAYQDTISNEVSSTYVLRNNIISYQFSKGYDRSKSLIIDPQLIFSTYSGSTADNFGYTSTYDEDGFLYAGGSVFNVGYPTTVGAYDVSFNSNPIGGTAVVYDAYFGWLNAGYGNTDIAITKYDSSGTKRIYSTYIGGDICEVPHSLIVNSKGELVIFGTTGSSNFPVSSNAFDKTFGGGTVANLSRGIGINYVSGSDIIVAKLSADGGQLLGSTYFGGSQNDGLNLFLNYNYADQMRGDVILDSADNVIIASCSFSSGLATAGAFQSVKQSLSDGIIAKFSSNLDALIWSSYLGGNGQDAAYSILLDKNKDIIVAGGTSSSNLSTTPGSLFSSYQGVPSDGFIGKIAANGNTLNKLTYFGSNLYDQIYFVKTDKEDNIFVFGQTEKLDNTFIINASYSVPNSGMFVSKLNNDLSSFIWSTTFGSGDGKVNLSPTAFMVDLCSNIYLSGWGSSSLGFALIPNYLKSPVGFVSHNGARGTAGMTVTADAFQKTTDGSDFYLMVLKDDASSLVYGSYYGGNLSEEHVDGGTSRFDKKGVMYQSVCAGCGFNSDFPIYPSNAVSPTNNADCNNGVFKFDFNIPTIVADFVLPELGCNDTIYTFKNTSNILNQTTYLWKFGDDSTSTSKSPNHQYKKPGTYEITLIISDPTSCNLMDSISKTINLKSSKSEFALNDTLCKGDSLQIDYGKTFGLSTIYNWEPFALFSNPSIAKPKVLIDSTVVLQLITNEIIGCYDTILFPVFVPEFDLKTNDVKACYGDSIIIGIDRIPLVFNYQWSSSLNFSDTLNVNKDSVSFKHKSLIDKVFYVKIKDKNNCEFLDSLNFKTINFSFEINNDSIVCDNKPINASILSFIGSQIDSISWSPSLQVISGVDSSKAVLSLYNYISDYFVYANDTNGCFDIDSLRIVNNTLDYSLNDTTICFGDTLQLGFKLDYNPLYTYEWYPDLVFEKDSLYSKAFPNDTIALNLIINNSFCIDTVSQTINVNRIQISASTDTVLCNHNGSVTLSAIGSDDLNYTWYYPQIFLDTLSKVVKSVVVNPGLSSQTYYVQAKDNWGCSDTAASKITKVLYELNYPSDTTLCLNDTVNLAPNENISGMGNLKFWWTPSSIITSDTSLSSVKAYGDIGEWKVIVKSENENACSDVDTISVKFASLDTSIVNLSINDTIISRGEEIVITTFPANANYFFTPESPISSEDNLYTFKPQESTIYYVEAQDQLFNKCRRTSTVQVIVLDFECLDPFIYVPNAFTPNGDGDNDVLYVRGKNLSNLYFAIFNRWGQKVFETTNQHIGWDGIYQGMKIDPAVYDYYLKYECEGKKDYFKKGNITLIR